MNSREESLDIIFDGNLIPRVNIELNGKPVSFIVDTGCEWSAITKKQLKDLESTEDKIIADTQSNSVWVFGKIKSNRRRMRFEVEDMIDNIFGLDFLWLFTCKIDLINMKLIFREENNFFKRTYLMTIVNIEGKDVAVLIDTGYSGYVLGPLSLAQEIALPLQECAVAIEGSSFESNSKQGAVNLNLKAAGRETSEAQYLVLGDDIWDILRCGSTPVLGSAFLIGMQLQFNADGSCEIKGRGWQSELDGETLAMLEKTLGRPLLK